MRHAPPVSVLCRGRAWRLAQCVVAAGAGAVGLLWLLQHAQVAGWLPELLAAPFPGLEWPSQPAPAALACGWALVAAAGATAAAIAWHLSRSAPLELRWTGRQWQADGRAVQLQLMLDLGAAVLLRWRLAEAGRHPPCWTAVTRGEAGPAWHALRVALHAHRPAERDAPPAWP